MTTCERCGANAVDALGVCRACGWETAGTGLDELDDTPSLGETRAADLPPGVRLPDTGAAYQADAAADRTKALPHFPSTIQTADPSTPPSPTGTGRFCGACGARIVGSEAFCGQCGTPVGMATGIQHGSSFGMPPAPPSPYQLGSAPAWPSPEGDAPTEAFVASPLARYSGPGYASVNTAQAGGPSRGVRIVVGALCLVGSVVSAITAVLLAIR